MHVHSCLKAFQYLMDSSLMAAVITVLQDQQNLACSMAVCCLTCIAFVSA